MKLSIVAQRNRYGLFEGTSYQTFKDVALAGIDYEVIDCDQPTPPRGDRILLMGQTALNRFYGNQNLMTFRGTVCRVGSVPAIATFDLQEAYDFTSDKALSAAGFEKDHQPTQRRNWIFWINADTKKLLREYLPSPLTLDCVLQPNIDQCTSLLRKHVDTLYLDIETDIESDTLNCIGFAVNDSPVYVVPIYNYKHQLVYSQEATVRFLAALSSAMLRGTTVVHNAMFDLLWLASHHRLPFGRHIFDTMVAHRRFFPEIEKSLGHCISYWTDQPYHKDEGGAGLSRDTQEKYWTYNAKDVFTTRLVYQAQLAYLVNHPEYKESIYQAQSSIYPYLLASLRGVRIDVGRMAAAKQKLDIRLKHVRRCIQILVGNDDFNPDSPIQLVRYFHTTLSYKVVSRTEKGAPSLGGKALYELALLYPNPLIQAILYYREQAKERTQMEFCNWIFPWKTL